MIDGLYYKIFGQQSSLTLVQIYLFEGFQVCNSEMVQLKLSESATWLLSIKWYITRRQDFLNSSGITTIHVNCVSVICRIVDEGILIIKVLGKKKVSREVLVLFTSKVGLNYQILREPKSFQLKKRQQQVGLTLGWSSVVFALCLLKERKVMTNDL